MNPYKIFAILAIIAISLTFTNKAHAQYVERHSVDSTIVGTKYVTWPSTKSGATGFQLTAVKDTGTLAGTVTLEQSIDTIPTQATRVWRQVGTQSFTLTNTTSPQGDIFGILPQTGNGYRFKIVTTGGKAHLYAAYLHR